ncbi:hypothetical protein BDQ17DRAFT_1355311 [Cyathus striatus]|nr:hypothetical protein BDQ17DRAFT_1355311 [Cyathus striatus]
MTTTAGSTAKFVLVDRPEIHKSCRAMETLLNVFNDYCEAAGAVVLLQKKLAKALRETAALKVTTEVAGNAMNASATVFEALSDVDTKFAKIADREYDAISGEVKKWFKKLAKDEKNHDDRLANANARIKQAGLAYEKKSKKKTLDATEEHTRYINLISTLGPEISQDKQDHMIGVSQRHAITTYSVAGSLSRLADAEWLRTCECVRRFSPTIGPLGEWRALCEGGWAGNVPSDLPDIEPLQETNQQQQYDTSREELHPPTALANADLQESSSRGSTEYQRPDGRAPPPVYETPISTPQREYLTPSTQHDSPPTQRQNVTIQDPLPSPQRPYVAERASFERERIRPNHPPSAYESPRPLADPSSRSLIDPNTGSLRSLSAFPAPPTHFPLPPPRPKFQESSQDSDPRMRSESPLPINEVDKEGRDTVTQDNERYARRASPVQVRTSASPSPEQSVQGKAKEDTSATTAKVYEESKVMPEFSPPISTGNALDPRTPTPVIQTTPATVGHSNSQHSKDGYFEDTSEFGIVPSTGRSKPGEGKSKSLEKEHGRTSSIVAAMQSRYSNTSGSSSPAPKDIPRLPLSVTDLATRYQPPTDPPLSPRKTQAPLPPESPTRARYYREQERSPVDPRNNLSEDNYRKQQELKDKERELFEREREIELRSRELDRDRTRLAGLREGEDRGSGNSAESQIAPLRPRRRSLLQQFQRPLSQVDGGRQAPISERPRSQYGYPNATAGVPPSPRFSQDTQPPSPAQYRPPPISRASEYARNHPANCTCESCSIARYRSAAATQSISTSTSTSSQDVLRPPEKKGNWIRRLSMPTPFNLDSSKKNPGKGVMFIMDGKKNASVTNLKVDDPRRSYDVGGNRSMTNLRDANVAAARR